MPPTSSSSIPISPAELSYLHTSLSLTPPIRPDLRAPTEFRPFHAETDVLPNCHGSAHLSLADGSEALVGIKVDTQRTSGAGWAKQRLDKELATPVRRDRDSEVLRKENDQEKSRRGDPEWVHLSVDISTLRDDDQLLISLAETLREPLVTLGSVDRTQDRSLADGLVINSRWHWELYIDVLLLSPYNPASGSTTATGYPLPLLSLAIHLALRDTRLPKLKSQGEEDPLVDDDWEKSEYIYRRPDSKDSVYKEERDDKAGGKSLDVDIPSTRSLQSTPPLTFLVITVGSNIIFDPSNSELAVADSVIAVSVLLRHHICPPQATKQQIKPSLPTTTTTTGGTTEPRTSIKETKPQSEPTIIALRTLDPPARYTIKGVAASAPPSATSATAAAAAATTRSTPLLQHQDPTDLPTNGLWKNRVGGIQRDLLKKVAAAVVVVGSATSTSTSISTNANTNANANASADEAEARDMNPDPGVATGLFNGIDAFLMMKRTGRAPAAG